MSDNDLPLVTTDEIRQAAAAIAPSVRRTPMAESPSLGEILGGIRLLLKLEMFQKTGSFKPRGVLNRMAHLTDDERSRGVVSLSAGNHAQALAYAASAAVFLIRAGVHVRLCGIAPERAK